jgi:hypothetical protein
MLKKYRYFDIIEQGPLFDPEPGEKVEVSHSATHAYRDMSMIKIIRQWGEILKNGLCEPREVGQYLIDLAREAEELEKEVQFGYEK